MNYPLRYVDHTYRDYSSYLEDGGKIAKHKKSEKNFPAKVHQMLSDPRNADAIAWMPHGRAWRVLDKSMLMDEVIPQYLVCKKYDSFSRQLNGWGFKRLYQTGPDKGCYYHECFLRGKPKLTSLIRRLPTNLGKATPYPEGEPNFYRIDEAYPLPPPSSSSPEAEANRETVTTSDEPPTIHHQPDVMLRPPAPSTQPSTKSEETPPRGQPTNEHPMDANATESVAPSFVTRPPPASRGATEPVAPSFASRAPPAFRDPAAYEPYAYPPNADSYYARDGYYQQQQPPPTSTAPFNQEYSPYYQQHSPSRSSVPYAGESYGYPGRRYEYGEYGMPDGQHPNIPPSQHQQPWPPPPQYPGYQYPPTAPPGPPVAREPVPNADQTRGRASVESWPRQCSISRRGSSVQPEDDLEPIPFSPRQASNANVGSDLIQRNRTM